MGGTPDNLRLVIRSATTSPLPGVQFATPQPARNNDNGDVAFFSNVTGAGVTAANDFALWLVADDGTSLIAREGWQAVGTPAGVLFGNMDSTLALNNFGQIAFTSPLTGTGVTSANDRGLWAGSSNDLFLVAREGDVIDLDPGPGELLKTISGTDGISFAVGYGTTTFNGSSGFNDAGQIAWQATFTDATTAILLSTLPSTEPNADFDDDGDVDGRDFLIWQRGFGLSGQDDNSLGDADFSGTINGEDLVVWQDQYGGIPPLTTSPVPEPESLMLILLGLMACDCRRGGVRH
jgi:hypothetical protein